MYIRIGSKGDLVRKIQSTLEESGLDPGRIDGIFGDKTRKAVVKLQESKKLEADGVAGPITLEALNIKAELPAPELERKMFRELLLKNPNYFGNIKVSPFELVKKIKNNTAYEELKCVGYNPHLEQLEAVVYIKKDYGYSGDICSSGTPEYVRFYVDWNNDGNWVDVGMTSFTAYDVPSDKPLEYDVTLKLLPREKFCRIENLPKVRAILSWNNPPTPNDSDFSPVWGNVEEAQIQIDVLKFIPIGEFVNIAKVELPKDLLTTIDLSQPASVLEPHELSLAELKEIYRDKGVPAHRFGFSHVQKLLAKPILTKELATPEYVSDFEGLDIKVSDLVDNLLKTDGNTHYEELECIGFNPDESALTGVITVKLPYGYSGDLCKKGSYEHTAFWEWDEIEQMWIYLGTASVNVHDIKNITRSGLQYSVVLPVDLSHHRRPCTSGASVVRIRAVLSWQALPSTTNPHKIPAWGNREETTIHIKPGPMPNDEPIPYIDGVGSMAVCSIDQGTGLATGESAGTAVFTAPDSPFGGTVTITGFIDNAPKFVMEGTEDPVKYKIFVRPYDPTKPDAENPWQPLANTFNVWVNEQTGPGVLPRQRRLTQKIDSDGYYTYLEDIHGSAWRKYAVGNILAKWVTSGLTWLWEVKIKAKKPDGTIIPGGSIGCPDGSARSIVKVRLDNERPFADVTITGYRRGSDPTVHTAEDCGTFIIGDVIVGKYTATDQHFRAIRLSVQPDPNPALPWPAKPKPDPMGPTTYPAIGGAVDRDWELDTKDMRACGYTVRLWTEDRTIVNGGYIGWERGDYVGFCLEEAAKKKEK
ncbi:MAG: peptidoglycan-binding domain-containing protein [Euryarchaeota archaeon]|nr:peptidoglycan-binding domain-containing protein [Euryarchaeota archaeon]